jgi:hypothetical protein
MDCDDLRAGRFTRQWVIQPTAETNLPPGTQLSLRSYSLESTSRVTILKRTSVLVESARTFLATANGVTSMRTVLFFWLATLLVLCVSPLPVKERLHTQGAFHDIAHVIAFSVTGILLARDPAVSRVRHLWVLSAFSLALLTEWLEFSAYHMHKLEWHDVAADAAGILLAMILMRWKAASALLPPVA